MRCLADSAAFVTTLAAEILANSDNARVNMFDYYHARSISGTIKEKVDAGRVWQGNNYRDGVEVKDESTGTWSPIERKDIKKGDVFRTVNPDGTLMPVIEGSTVTELRAAYNAVLKDGEWIVGVYW
jgi:hypothetical protein